MNKILMSLVFTFSIAFCHSQVQQTPAQQLAEKIAQKMKDSLSLNNHTKDQLYAINMQLHDQKMAIRQQYSGNDSLRIKIQKIENKRDSLYRNVLSTDKYLLYQQKKRNLIRNN